MAACGVLSYNYHEGTEQWSRCEADEDHPPGAHEYEDVDFSPPEPGPPPEEL